MSAMLSKEQAVREIWLLYFNRVLMERGMITEKEHNKMKARIQGIYSAGGSKG